MRLRPILLAALASVSLTAQAERIGSTFGQTWAIEEPDLIEQIHELIGRMQASGEMGQIEQRFREETLAAFSDPPPVPGIGRATENRSWHFDPTAAFSEDVKDDAGRVVARAGTRYNPFQFITLTKSLIFIDARDEPQIAVAQRYLAQNPLNRIVLVGGSWRKLQDRLRVRIYYDQHGKLTKHFGITRVPAILSQDGMQVRIDEVTQ